MSRSVRWYRIWKIKHVSLKNLQKILNKYCQLEWQVESILVVGKKYTILFYRHCD